MIKDSMGKHDCRFGLCDWTFQPVLLANPQLQTDCKLAAWQWRFLAKKSRIVEIIF
jgi:hypothetical protein